MITVMNCSGRASEFGGIVNLVDHRWSSLSCSERPPLNLRLAQLPFLAREVTIYRAHEIVSETIVLALYSAFSLVSLELLTGKLMVRSKCSSRIIVQEMLEITTKIFLITQFRAYPFFTL